MLKSRVPLDILKCILGGAIKICICPVILGKPECFRNYKGFSITKVRIFLIPLSLSITFLNPKILGFVFYYELKFIR